MNLAIGLRNLRRAREILSVLVLDYGFGYVFDHLGVSGLLPLGRRRRGARERPDLSGPRRLRLALAELGPAFIKLAQTLSTRADLLPPDIVAELRHLQDRAPAISLDEIRGVVETELGRPIEQCFAEFDPTPLASASLGQVHGAALRDGREVTVKVLRPGLRKVIEEDLQILSDAAYLLHRQVLSLQRFNLPAFVRQFAGQLEDELNYTIEAHNSHRLRRGLSEAGMSIRIPEVVWGFTTGNVLTTEHLRGRRVDRLSDTANIDRAAAAGELGRYMLRQIFVDGFFHADPHQGNVLIADDGAVILLDFGIVGYLDPRTRDLLAEAVRRAYDEDVDGLLSTMCELGTVGHDTDFGSLRSELARAISRFVVLPRREFSVGKLLSGMVRALWLNDIRVPAELSLAAKTLLMTEAIASELDPDFDFRDLAQPVMEEARARLLAPNVLAERVVRSIESTARRLARLPARIDNVLSLIEHGSLRLRTEDARADERWSRLGRGLNRLGLSLLAAALLAASTVYLVSAEHPLHTALGVAAMVGGVSLGLVVVLAILRPGQV
ncbi:MAG: AarF/ABC1/UbiB kinase family protein [Armatimonadota bacterium]|nr:MAG: AarF/ABC1/UbiB kinase family protein [Armatimonadota bacterium]